MDSPTRSEADAREAIERRYAAGDFVFWEGDEPEGLYCLEEGCLALRRAEPDGHETIVRLVVPGQLFGYEALLAERPHEVSAQALVDLRVTCLAAARSRAALGEPAWLRRITAQMAVDLGRAEDLHHTRTWHSVALRAAGLIERLALAMGTKGPDGALALESPARREDLAAAIGALPDHFDRALDELVRQGLISRDGPRRLVVRELARLQAYQRLGVPAGGGGL